MQFTGNLYQPTRFTLGAKIGFFRDLDIAVSRTVRFEPTPPCLVAFVGAQPATEGKQESGIGVRVRLPKVDWHPAPRIAPSMRFLVAPHVAVKLRVLGFGIAVAKQRSVRPYSVNDILGQGRYGLNIARALDAGKRVVQREPVSLHDCSRLPREA